MLRIYCGKHENVLRISGINVWSAGSGIHSVVRLQAAVSQAVILKLFPLTMVGTEFRRLVDGFSHCREQV